MRLLWISHLVPFPPKGGVKQRSYYLLREAARRHTVDFVGLAQPAHQGLDDELAEAENALRQFCSSVRTFWIVPDRRPWGRSMLLGRSFVSRVPYDVHWLKNSEMSRFLERAERSYDLVHVDTIGLTQYLDSVDGTPFVLNHHNVESDMMASRARTNSNPLKSFYMSREAGKLERWEQRWAPRSSVNLVVSPLDKERLRGQVGEKVDAEVVENGVDTDYFRPRTSPDDHDGRLIFVGRMSWYPNRDAMLWFIRDIWPRLVEDRPDREVALIGSDPPDELQEASEDDRVAVPGWVDDVRPAMDKAFAYVCPIRKGGGTRLKVLDALAMGKPLVATAFAVEGLGLDEEVHYLRAEEPGDYVEAVRRLESDRDLRFRLARNGRQLVEENYAWDVIGEHLNAAYRHAVDGSR